MRSLREYRFECCWLVLLIILFLLAPAQPSSATGFDWQDLAFDCDSTAGWCVPPIDLGRLTF
jgi:hypothetical protein